MKKLIYNHNTFKVCRMIGSIMVVTFLLSSVAFAATTTGAATTTTGAAASVDKIDQLASVIAGWFQKIGGVVTLFGAFQTAWGIKSDDPDGKSKGVKTAAAGAAVIAIATGYQMFTV